ncbi:MAG: pyruvate, phosphate dikinase [Peptococcaceae bacterium]|jgi:pyruvate,orthophosphate dikinase|nr:pyruvate, phosphate dikinase [Peptococcaceae bacterium]
MSTKKYVYLFHEGNAQMRALLGGKGANLAEMANMSLPVPPGFTITTEACLAYYASNGQFPEGLDAQIKPALAVIEAATGKKFGDPVNPLLVSVRSGAQASMPGMMDTVLNLGLNSETVQALATATQNERFALDSYRRFIHMFSNVVLELSKDDFEDLLSAIKRKQGIHFDSELSVDSLNKVIQEYKALVKRLTGKDFPEDPQDQLHEAILAVFRSWNNDRAIFYRKNNNIPDDWGTAVNVQSMVFGNMGDDSGTGVAFTRSPSTGEKALFGEYLMNAQGEDVVAGIRTPLPISSLAQDSPEIYQQFLQISSDLEAHYHDMQDIEFTIEKKKLYMLQTRNGKRTAAASIKVAVDQYHEGLITKEEAISRIEPGQLDQLLHRRIDDKAKLEVIAKGLPASPGAASGQIVLDVDEAERRGNAGEPVLLIRPETTPDDIHGIMAAQGVLTIHGGMTSHAAVVARHMGKPCVCGCESLRIDNTKREIVVSGLRFKEGDSLSIDGATGQVIKGEVPMIDPELSDEFKELLTWADEIRRLQVRANADNPVDAQKARDFGAQGIGLCRTEHMFMDPARIPIVQEMILSQSLEERKVALAKLLPMQEEDFYGILKAMSGWPVIIRLLDPPLHEFLPRAEDLLVEVTRLKVTGDNPEELRSKERLLGKVKGLMESNPMLGHRGCRLAITYPEIYAMQVQAIFQASARLVKEGIEIRPEVMIPLVIHVNELAKLRKLTEETAEKVMQENGVHFPFEVGTMIEVPRAALTADEIAEVADFFSFGTNDLTQTIFGFSRDDAESKFLKDYLNQKILPVNPFAVLDRGGVGKIMRLASELGRSKNKNLGIGICGEHGGEASSIEFCHIIGLDYVSCSPFRVPLARLAAAQAAINQR